MIFGRFSHHRSTKNRSGSKLGRFWFFILGSLTLFSFSAFLFHVFPAQNNQIPSSNERIYFQASQPKDFYAKVFGQTKNITGTNVVFPWGVTVPHHLLAADMIAKTLKQIENKNVELIFVFSPDHFNRGNTKITIADQPFLTSVGESFTDREILRTISSFRNVEINNEIFGPEHGIGSVLPFLQILWPKAKVVPILIRADAKKEDLIELKDFLKKQIAKPEVLLVESSDFSHYLSEDEANQKDQETINTLLSYDAEKILELSQPDHCDSINILYLMKSIQTETNADIEIFLHKNSQSYAKEKVAETTSYITFFMSEKPFEIQELE